MQLLIDTETSPDHELHLAIEFIDGVLTHRQNKVQVSDPSAEHVREVLATLDNVVEIKPGKTVVFGDVSTEGSRDIPPPPPTFSEDDPEVDIDDAGGIVPAAPPVIVPPVVPPAPSGSAAPLDKNGKQWDGRIHAANRAKTIGGTWKYKRGVDENLVKAVEAELQGAPSAATPSVPPVTLPTAANTLSATPPAPTGTTQSVVVPPAPGPVTSIQPITSANAAGAPVTFRSLMTKITSNGAGGTGKLTDELYKSALASVDLKPEELTSIIGNPLMIQAVNAAIDTCLGS